MVFIAAALIVLGAVTAVLGLNLFRLLLPLIGLAVGVLVGFGGVQGVFGTGVVSTTVAVIMALIVGVIMAILAYAFFEIAVVILSAMLFSSLVSYLGVALGLGDNGFVMLMLVIAGAILGLVIATTGGFSTSLMITLTSFAGISLIFVGIFLLAGNISLDELNRDGVFGSVLNVVDSAFIWFIAWIGGILVAMNVQAKTAIMDSFDDRYAYVPPKNK